MHHESNQRPAAPPAPARRASSAPHKCSLARFSAVIDALQSAQSSYPQQLRDKLAYTPLPPGNGNPAQDLDLVPPRKQQEIPAVNPCTSDATHLREARTPGRPVPVNLCKCEPLPNSLIPRLNSTRTTQPDIPV